MAIPSPTSSSSSSRLSVAVTLTLVVFLALLGSTHFSSDASLLVTHLLPATSNVWSLESESGYDASASSRLALRPRSLAVFILGSAPEDLLTDPRVTEQFCSHLLMPSLTRGFQLDLFLCANGHMDTDWVEDCLTRNSFDADSSVGWIRSVTTFAFPSKTFLRAMQCRESALLSAPPTPPSSVPVWDWLAVSRNDILIHNDVVVPPPLNPVEGVLDDFDLPSHDKEGELHLPPIYVRARMARGRRNLTTDHFSWQYDKPTCVDSCPAPCGTGSPRLFVTDDQFALVPNISADGYFNAYTVINNSTTYQQACGNRFSPGLEHVQRQWNEGIFTCALVASGLRFEPFALRAVLSPLVRHSVREWAGIVLPEQPIQKDCG
jgi:hypothetical protein